MKKLLVLIAAAGLSAGFLSAPSAFAQSSPAGDMKAPPLQPKAGDSEAPAPAAIPGMGGQDLATSQSVAKQQSGDPTTELFTAINGNDYASAQDAISRGADLNAQNSLGESPIDLSVALNRNSITFMLLAARNDSGDDSTDASVTAPQGVASAATRRALPTHKSTAVPVKLIENPGAVPGNDPGTPNSSAGFLGFNH